jgi:hypothetical protein
MHPIDAEAGAMSSFSEKNMSNLNDKLQLATQDSQDNKLLQISKSLEIATQWGR